MDRYEVTGMSCAACKARVEKAVSEIPGVSSCAVNLVTGRMGVDGKADPQRVIAAVRKAGYGARVLEGSELQEGRAAGSEKKNMIIRLVLSGLFMVPLMYISMGREMLGAPVPEFMEDVLPNGIIQMILAAFVIAVNNKFFIGGFKALNSGVPNMDTLVALGSGASYIYSILALALIAMETDRGYDLHFYFDSSAMILTLITVGKLLETVSKAKTGDALKSLMKLAPETAVIIRDNKEVRIPLAELEKRDVFVLRAGNRVPADGVVISGNGSVDESALTGESMPIDKGVGDRVISASTVKSGYMQVSAVGVGKDSTLAGIIEMVSDATATKAPIARTADRIAAIFVPTVMMISLLTFIVWICAGADVEFSLTRAICVLVISCPCALGLATPVAIMAGCGVGAKSGILFKSAAILEETGRAEIMALDKTGTITEGYPTVKGIYPYEGVVYNELLKCAFSLERLSSHPLSKAISGCVGENYPYYEIKGLETKSGLGLVGRAECGVLTAGNEGFISGYAEIPDSVKMQAKELSDKGETVMFFAKESEFLGVISVADGLRPYADDAIKSLKKLGVETVLLSGDNERTARSIAKAAGIDNVIAGILPGDKESEIRRLKKESGGRVIMTGDGINDAPALAAADIGFAVGSGTDVAIDAADVILMKSNPADIPAAIRLARRTLNNIKENLFWAFVYNIIGIPLAAGVFIPIWGWSLTPMYGAAAMSFSSFFVVINALRLRFIDIYDGSRDSSLRIRKKRKINLLRKKEDELMEKTLHIKGMMCEHCEATVKKALEAVDGVKSATADHNTGTAVVELNTAVSDEALTAAVTAKDYVVEKID